MPVIDNTARIIEWQVTRGDDWSLPFVKTNNPVSMSGWTFVAQIRESMARTSTLVASLTADTSAASSGTVTFSLASATTDTIAAGVYWWEIQRSVSGVLKTMCGGPLIVVADTADT